MNEIGRLIFNTLIYKEFYTLYCTVKTGIEFKKRVFLASREIEGVVETVLNVTPGWSAYQDQKPVGLKNFATTGWTHPEFK